MLELYTAATGNGRRPALMLEECGLAYAIKKVDLSKGEAKTPEFLKMNPSGAIPVLVDKDGGKTVTVAQSGAILLYLAEKTGKFLSKDPAKRATTLQWLMQACTDVAPASSGMFYTSTQVAPKSEEAVKLFETRFVNACRAADARLDGRDWLADEYSIADMALYSAVMARKELIGKTDGLANLKRWLKAIEARPAIAKGALAAA
jgi:GST-like protein